MVGIRLKNVNSELKEIRIGHKQLDAIQARVYSKIRENNQLALERTAQQLYVSYKDLPPIETGKLRGSINVFAGLRIAKVTWEADSKGFDYGLKQGYDTPIRPGLRDGYVGFMRIIEDGKEWENYKLILKNLYNRF